MLRIKETQTFEGNTIYFPQYKKWFFWFNFWDLTDFPPKCVKYYNIKHARSFIIDQKNKLKDKYHYI